MTELECQSNQTPVIKSQKTELNQTIEELENTLRDKEEVSCVCESERSNLSIDASHAPYVYITPPFNLFCVLQEMEKLKEELETMNDLMEQKDTLTQKLEVSERNSTSRVARKNTSQLINNFLCPQETELRSRVLEEQLAGAEQRLEENQEEQENFRKSLRTLLELLDGKIFELTELRDTLARLIEEAS